MRTGSHWKWDICWKTWSRGFLQRKPDCVTAPDSLEFSNDSVAVAAGTTDTITVDGGEAPFEAVSDDETIATVHVDGDTISITGIAVGTTSVAVTDKNGKNGKIAVAVE